MSSPELQTRSRPLREAEPSGEARSQPETQARPEVEISRQGRAQQSFAAGAERAQQSEFQAQPTGAREPPIPSLLAVRLGPAQPAQPSDPEEVVRRALSERATLQSVAQVLEQPEDGNRARAAERASAEIPGQVAPRVPGEDRGSQERPRILGEERGTEPRPAPALPGQTPQPERLVSTPGADRRAPEAPEPAPPPTAEREQVEGLTEPEGDDLDVASQVAPSAGNVPQSEDSRRDVPVSFDERDDAGEEVAQRELTESGVVFAETADENVTRFLDNRPRENPGPEPRAPEVLGQRPRPL